MSSSSQSQERVHAGASVEVKDSKERQKQVAEHLANLKERDEEMFARLDSDVFKRFGTFLGPYKRAVIVAAFAVILFSAANLAFPFIIKIGVDNAIQQDNTGLLAWIAIGLIATAGLYWFSLYLQQVLTSRVALNILYDIRRDIFLQLQRLGMSFFDRTPIGSLMSRMFGDVGALQEMLNGSLQVIGDFLTLIGIIVVLLVLSWKLALLTFAVLPALILLRVFWQPYARRAFLRVRRNSSVVGQYLDQNVSGIRVVQAMNRQEVNSGIMGGKVDTYFWSTVKGASLSGVLMPVVNLLTGVALMVVVLMGGNMVLHKTLDVGVMIAFFIYVQQFFAPIQSITMQYSALQRAVAAGHRIFELLDLPIEVADKPNARPIGNIDGLIEFQHVTFGYKPDQPILKDITFRAEAGQTVAIVGPTGSGKTSITALAHRFYDVQEGRVLVGGVDVRDVTQESLGRVMGMVLQEPFLYSQTVFDNVRFNTMNATREDVVEACKTIGADDFIMKLPDGYDTVLEQRGSNLSVGQRQLLSFARALVADPKILVLDEATANIDSYTEMVIQEALKKLLEGRTALVIAHRLSTIRNAHKIIVVQAGRIVEEGPHDVLVKQGGLYAQLWSMNYASFDDMAGPDDSLVSAPASAT